MSKSSHTPLQNFEEGATALHPLTAAAHTQLADRLLQLEERVRSLEVKEQSKKATIVLFSGDLDKVLAALVIATGAATMGLSVTVFHTFWGLMPLRRGRNIHNKGLAESLLNLMTPAGLSQLSPSKLAFAGAGAKLFRKRMKDQGVQSPEDLYALAKESGVRFIACEMSMEVMGLAHQELVEGVEVGGVGAYLGEAVDSRITLFI